MAKLSTKIVALTTAAASLTGCVNTRTVIDSVDPERVGEQNWVIHTPKVPEAPENCDHTSHDLSKPFDPSGTPLASYFFGYRDSLTPQVIENPNDSTKIPFSENINVFNENLTTERETDWSRASFNRSPLKPKIDPMIDDGIGLRLKVPYDSLLEIPANTGEAIQSSSKRWYKRVLVPSGSALKLMILGERGAAYLKLMEIGHELGKVSDADLQRVRKNFEKEKNQDSPESEAKPSRN